MAAMTRLGHRLMAGIALSLGLEESVLRAIVTTSRPADPVPDLQLPAVHQRRVSGVHEGVGEHTDYGLLTILRQDMSAGLEVKSNSRWIAAPPIANSFVCNIGDMLDRMTGGLLSFDASPRPQSGRASRLSFPFFFDPNFHAEAKPIELSRQTRDNKDERWDRASVHDFRGTYGEYLLSKVAKVFPQLKREVL